MGKNLSGSDSRERELPYDYLCSGIGFPYDMWDIQMIDNDQDLISAWIDEIRVDPLRLNIELVVEWTTNNMIEQIPSEDQGMFREGSLDKERRTRCSSYENESTFLHWEWD